MKNALLALAVVALAVPVAATGDQLAEQKVAGGVLAIESSRAGDLLVRVDAQTLKPRSKGLALGGHAFAWSFSPDGRRLALGVGRQGVVIVDARRMKRLGRIPTWSGGIASLAWVSPRRIVGWEGAGLFRLDPVARKRLWSPQSPGDVLKVSRAGNRLVLLAAPTQQIGEARLAVVGGNGVVRTVRLDRIRAGTRFESDGMNAERHDPALVIDSGRRAFVLGAAQEPVAEVDLTSLQVAYHQVSRERPLWSRFRNWLEPTAEAKLPMLGSSRYGIWLGDGRIAVFGFDAVPAGPEKVETKPAGLVVVDTSDWTSRMVDPNVQHAMYAGGTLLAGYQQGGLSGFSPSGDRRYHVFDGDALGVVATFDSRAFVAFDHKPVHVVEAATGDVLGTRRGVPRLLHRSFSGW
jgi:hypothetical protein